MNTIQSNEAILGQALDLYDQRRYSECLEPIKQALIVNPGNAYLYLTRGDARYALQDYRGAAAEYIWALRCSPYYFSAAMNAGNMYYQLKQYEKSLTYYERALFIDHEDVFIHYNIANTYAALGLLSEACDEFSSALARDPTYAGCYLNRAHVLSRMGKQQEALSDYRKALALNPNDSNIAWTVAWVQFGQETITEEKAHNLERISQLAPLHYTSALCYGVAALVRGYVKASLAFFEQAHEWEPDEWDVPFWIGMASALCGETEIARRSIEAALDMGLPPLLLKPLYWLETQCHDFFEQYAKALLQRFDV